MLKRIKNNVEDHKLIDNGRVVYDVTSVELPTIEHPTSEIKASGMAGTFEVPNEAEVNAMELSVHHNGGENSERLADGGRHEIEFRTVRQSFNVAESSMDHESVKYRFTCFHKSSDGGEVEAGNPLPGVDKFSVVRYEKIVSGNTVVLIDIASGIIRINGTDYAGKVQNLLN